MVVQILKQEGRDLILFFGIICVAGLIHWLRIFLLNKSQNPTLTEFAYSIYINHAARIIYMYKGCQAIPIFQNLVLLADFRSEDQSIRKGISMAEYLATQLDYEVVVMFEKQSEPAVVEL